MGPHFRLVLVFLILAAPAPGQMTPVGGELTVAQSSGVLHRSPAVAAGELGDFIVVWQRHAGGPEGWDVLARLYDRSGAPVGRPTVASDASGRARPLSAPEQVVRANA